MSKILNVYLLRHGQTSMNAEGNKYCGLTDVELTELGVKQAKAAAVQLENIKLDAVYASPLVRSRRTAELLNLGMPVTVDERLIELDFGSWEGKTREEFIRDDPRSWENWNTDPLVHAAGGDGETAQSVIDRLKSFFKEINEKHAQRNIVIVGHNGLNRILLAHLLGMPLKNYRSILQENSCVTLFSITGDNEFQLQKLNCKG